MSHAPTTLDGKQDPAKFYAAVDENERMLREGASWSGRERNCLYLNTQDGSFANVSAISGIDFDDDARSCGRVDWDEDGDLDLWITNRNGPQLRFLRNDRASSHRSVAFRLEGDGKATNRDAIGARIELRLAGDERPLLQTLRAGEGFLSQGTRWVHFGVGDAAVIERVTVRWPGAESAGQAGGLVEEFRGATPGGRFVLTQGSGSARAVAARPPTALLEPKELTRTKPAANTRAVISGRVAPPAIAFVDANGKARSIGEFTKQPLLINFFASWCPTCRSELTDFADARRELQNAGVKVLALSLDDTDDHPETAADAKSLLREMKFPFPSGAVDVKTVESLRAFYGALFDKHPPLPVPTSLLLDDAGRVAVFYKGYVASEQIRADVQLLNAPPDRWLDLALPLKGRRFSDVPEVTPARFAPLLARESGPEAGGRWLVDNGGDALLRAPAQQRLEYHTVHLRFAAALRAAGKPELALEQAEQALRFLTDSPFAHLRVGELLLALGRAAAAEQHLNDAVRLDPRLQEEADRARASGGK